jgi:hypothetical protein
MEAKGYERVIINRAFWDVVRSHVRSDGPASFLLSSRDRHIQEANTGNSDQYYVLATVYFLLHTNHSGGTQVVLLYCWNSYIMLHYSAANDCFVFCRAPLTDSRVEAFVKV